MRPFVPVAARLLLGAAVLDVVVQVLGRGLIGGYRDASPSIGIGVLLYASPFVLAAAAIIGAPGWPLGRPWLLAGAGLFAIAGLLNLGFWLWSWAQTGGTSIYPDVTENMVWWLNARAAAEAGVRAGASLLIAVGLWMARPSTGQGRPSRRALLLDVALLGLASAAGFVAVGILTTTLHSEVSSVEYPLLALGVAMMTGIALAAIAILPRRGQLPEVAIAVGAMLIVVATGATAWLVFTPANEPRLWMAGLLTFLGAAQLIGLLALAGGLAMGRLVAPVAAEGRN